MMRKYALIVLAALVTAPVSAQEVERISGREVAIYNIAGHVRVVRGSGSDVEVRIERDGRDASELTIETGEIRGRQTLRVVYPDDQIVYPEMGRGSNSSSRVRADGTFSDGGMSRGTRVDVRGSGSGLEAWADLEIAVPDGQRISIYLMVGSVEAMGIDGDVDIDTGSGEVVTTDMAGTLSIDTGSGSIVVDGMSGNLSVDTGSGRIEVAGVSGDEVNLDTGSGRIQARDVTARSFNVDTGSGGIDLERIAAPEIMIDTGSGSVELELLTDVELLEVDTGSGSVTVYAPSDLGARIEVDTGSGSIDLDFPVEVRIARRDHMEGRIGDGRGEIVIDTGSGSIRFIRSRAPVR